MQSLSQDKNLLVRSTPTQAVAAQALKESIITPGVYTPRLSFLTAKSIGIVMDGKPIVLLGFEGDEHSNDVADRLLASQQFHVLVKYEFGEYQELTKEIVSNDSYCATKGYKAIVKSEQGKIEHGHEEGRLEAVLPLGTEAFGFGMCVSNELAKCFFPDAVDISCGIVLA